MTSLEAIENTIFYLIVTIMIFSVLSLGIALLILYLYRKDGVSKIQRSIRDSLNLMLNYSLFGIGLVWFVVYVLVIVI